jgi:hypothetical protein
VIGHAVVEGIRLPILEIRLRDGGMDLRCHLEGPVSAVEGGAVTVFGEDGTGICQGRCDGARWQAVGPGETLTVRLEMKITWCYGDAEEPVAST